MTATNKIECDCCGVAQDANLPALGWCFLGDVYDAEDEDEPTTVLAHVCPQCASGERTATLDERTSLGGVILVALRGGR